MTPPKVTHILREGVLYYDTPEGRGVCEYQTRDAIVVLTDKSGARLVFDREQLHAASAPGMEKARQSVLNMEHRWALNDRM